MNKEQQQRLKSKLESDLKAFRQQRYTLQLATVDQQGQPNVSYAPFVQNQHGYFVLISELARHTQNLLTTPNVSLMMVEDEAASSQLYARVRLTFDATAHKVERDSRLWQQVISQMEERHGDIVSGLIQLQDFILFHFLPQKGLFVKGFGQAYPVSAENMVDTTPLLQGHRKMK
ncbi:heme utilization protein HutZ [Vibrio sp. 404]|uniref:Heme utilization protein HutZ n=1 Tax=Vibrio marinisediminis TaxID=2758441 RepID=A0A7W2ISD3_9VIBR|nr:heme utilization protein HutZ [Vibrio marinisediminis]MBA5760973.1 heme utilization protein HutZ [Vibrio marinisediminis]